MAYNRTCCGKESEDPKEIALAGFICVHLCNLEEEAIKCSTKKLELRSSRILRPPKLCKVAFISHG